MDASCTRDNTASQKTATDDDVDCPEVAEDTRLSLDADGDYVDTAAHFDQREVADLGSSKCAEGKEAQCKFIAAQEFEVSVTKLSGASMNICGLLPDDTLQSFYWKVADALAVPRSAVKLALGDNAFTPDCYFKTLTSVGIHPGAELSFFFVPGSDVTAGMRIKVEQAGTSHVNGVYVGRQEVPNAPWCPVVFFKDSGMIQSPAPTSSDPTSAPKSLAPTVHPRPIKTPVIRWYPDSAQYPAGWYINESHSSCSTHYFVASDDMKWLPMQNWSPYNATRFSLPGAEPMPIVSKEC